MVKKGQIGALAIPIITFAVIVLGLIFIAPFMLKIIDETSEPLNESFSNINPEYQGYSVFQKFRNIFDVTLIVIMFFFGILMLISAFLVDTHPAFLIVYIILAVFLFLFAPAILDAGDRIWESSDFVQQRGELPLTDFVRESFGVVMVGFYLLSGVILFAKVRGGRGDV